MFGTVFTSQDCSLPRSVESAVVIVGGCTSTADGVCRLTRHEECDVQCCHVCCVSTSHTRRRKCWCTVTSHITLPSCHTLASSVYRSSHKHHCMIIWANYWSPWRAHSTTDATSPAGSVSSSSWLYPRITQVVVINSSPWLANLHG